MYLLILKSSIRPFVTCFPFTFHNVSINSADTIAYILGEEHLHSIMYLLILRAPEQLCCRQIFTFHNVSINSFFPPVSYIPLSYLHSIMYLLIQICSCPKEQFNHYLHSIMYLLIPVPSKL